MYAFRLRAAAVALVAGIGLTACTTPYGSGVSVGIGNGYNDPYYGGYGYGGGYPGYGYGSGYGYSAGYGYGAGYPGYGYGAGYPGYGYGYAPWGWYDNLYYPGTGYYVYDSYRRPHRWTDAQRRYWESRRSRGLTVEAFRRMIEAKQQNWADFDAGPTAAPQVQQTDDQPARVVRTRPVRVDRSTTQAERAAARADRIERSRTTQTERPAVRADRVERSRATQTERRSTRASSSNSTEQAERTRPVRAERSTARAERQATRAASRSEVRAERASRSSSRRDQTSEE